MIAMLDFLLADLNPRSLPFAQTKSLYVDDEATHILRPFKDHADDHRHVIGSPLGRTSGGPYPLPVSVRGPLVPHFVLLSKSRNCRGRCGGLANR